MARRDVYGGLIAVQLFFAVQYPLAKLLLEEVPPRAWALLRVLAGALVLLTAARVLGRPFPRRRRHLVSLAGLALFGVVLNQLGFIEGLHRTSASHAAILMTTIPVTTLLFAVLLGRERVDLRRCLALGVAFGGALLVIGPGGGRAGASLAGDLLILANGLSFSFFLVASKRTMTEVDPVGGTAVLLAFGSLGMAVAGGPELIRFDAGAVSARTWWIAAYIVVFPTALAYLINAWALSKVDSSLVGLLIYLQPVLATALAIVLLGERPAPATAAGAALIFAAVYLALRRSQRQTREVLRSER